MGTHLIWQLLVVLSGSFTVCAFLVLTQRWHGRLSLDHDLSGAQKLHRVPVPRVGGVGVATGLVTAALTAFVLGEKRYTLMVTLLLCASPVFLAGLSEDITKRISVKARLVASFASAALAIWTLDAELVRLDTPVLDSLITFVPLSILFTCFAVGGMTHAVNIIDGLNGLAAGSAALMLSGLAAMAWQVGDTQILNMSIWGIAALFGFLCLNFPFGRIFLGDGGAYLAGFWVAECGVLLLKRNPEVSTWAVLLCCIYPVWETAYSVYRRQVVQRTSSGLPDMTHMHHLVYKRVAQQQGGRTRAWKAHGRACMLIWTGMVLCPVTAALAYRFTPVLIGSTLLFVLGYNFVYRCMQPPHSTKETPINRAVTAEGN